MGTLQHQLFGVATLARALNGAAPLQPTIVGGLVFVWLHRVLGIVAGGGTDLER